MRSLKEIIGFKKMMSERGFNVKFNHKGDVVCRKVKRDIVFDKDELNLAKRVLKKA